MEMEVRVLHSQREVVSSRLMGFLNAEVLPCWLNVSQNKNYHGDANAPRLPRWDNACSPVLLEGFLFFLPIATASVVDNSHHNNAVMNAFLAQLSAGRPGWCWALCCRISRAPQTAVQTLWILEAEVASTNCWMCKKKNPQSSGRPGLNSFVHCKNWCSYTAKIIGSNKRDRNWKILWEQADVLSYGVLFNRLIFIMATGNWVHIDCNQIK